MTRARAAGVAHGIACGCRLPNYGSARAGRSSFEGGRSFSHSRTEANVAYLLKAWVNEQPAPPGTVLSGEAGFRLRQKPPTVVGTDVAYVSAARIRKTPRNAFLIESAPVLAVKIVSPSDQSKDVEAKVRAYLDAGTSLVWRVESAHAIITVFRPDAEPIAFNIHDELTAEPHLPGFRVKVSDIFA